MRDDRNMDKSMYVDATSTDLKYFVPCMQNTRTYRSEVARATQL